MCAEVKEHFKPRSLEKRVPVDPILVKKFFTCMSDGAKEKMLDLDFDCTLKKAYQKKVQSGKAVPQLGIQPNKLELLRVPTELDQHAQQFMVEMGLNAAQAAGHVDIPLPPVFSHSSMENILSVKRR